MATEVILLVDGHSTTRAVMAQVLRDEGFVTLEAPDGEEAVRLARTHSPALVLVDLSLAEAWNSLLLKTLKTVLPVVAISNSPTASLCAAEPYCCADGVLEAPFHLAELLAVVRRGLVVGRTASPRASAARMQAPTSPA